MKSKWPLWYTEELIFKENDSVIPDKIDGFELNYKETKRLSIDFICQKSLALTALREFFEIFLSSIRKDSAFHFEILSGFYRYMGV